VKLGRLDATTTRILDDSQNSSFLLESSESLRQLLIQEHVEFKYRFLSSSKEMIQSLEQSMKNSLPTFKPFGSDA